ncbi:MAG: hypothetical protein Q9170_001977 [Blastenia crenularia]
MRDKGTPRSTTPSSGGVDPFKSAVQTSPSPHQLIEIYLGLDSSDPETLGINKVRFLPKEKESYGVYLSYYLSHSLYPSSSPIDYAIVGGLNFSIAMLIAPIVTIIARVYGPHIPMLMGVVFQAGGFICASFAYRIWHVYLCQGALVGLGVGFTYIPSTAILSQWFTAKRSLANGISTAGSGIGGLIFSFATGAMIRNLGVSWSLRITGVISGVINLIATLMIRHRNEAVRPPQRGLDLHLLRQPDVLLLLCWAFVSTLGYMTLLFSLPDFARSVGLSMERAAATQAFVNLGTAVGRPLTGVLSDRFGRVEVAGVLTLGCGVSVFAVWMPAREYGVTVLFAILSGGIMGVFYVTVGPLAAEIRGLAELPSLLSLAWLSVAVPAVCEYCQEEAGFGGDA